MLLEITAQQQSVDYMFLDLGFEAADREGERGRLREHSNLK